MRALLAAMGVDADTDADIERALATHSEARWRQTLAPVVVVRSWRTRSVAREPCRGAGPGDALLAAGRRDRCRARGRAGAGDVHRGRERGLRRRAAGRPRFRAATVCRPLGYHRLSSMPAMLCSERPCSSSRPPPVTVHPRSMTTAGSGAPPFSSMHCVRRATGASAISPICPRWRAMGGYAARPSSASTRCTPCSRNARRRRVRTAHRVDCSSMSIYLDVEAITDFGECEEARALVGSAAFQATLHRLRSAELVDYPASRSSNAACWHCCMPTSAQRISPSRTRGPAFRGFCARRRRGTPAPRTVRGAGRAFFSRQCVALRLARVAGRVSRSAFGCRRPLRRRTRRACRVLPVAAMASRTAARRRRNDHPNSQASAIGLYADLAVSIDRCGGRGLGQSTHLCRRCERRRTARPVQSARARTGGWRRRFPARLREAAYAPFIATLRANMHHAGALRIDHVMGLMRLFWVPRGAAPADGAYVHYPFADLLGILALESQRHRCLVIGEDLGTVPEDLRAALAQAGVLSYRLLCSSASLRRNSSRRQSIRRRRSSR